MDTHLNINSVLGDLALVNGSISISEILLTVFDIFEKNKTIPGLVLLKEGKFYGLLSRAKFFELMSKQFMYDIYSKRTIDFFFEEDTSEMNLIFNSSTSIIAATNEALKRSVSAIYEPIIIECFNHEYRLLDFHELLMAQNKIQEMMNDQLKQANEFKNEVLAIAAHDLRNPIGVILGFSNLMVEVNDIEKSKEYGLYVQKTAAHMESIVNSFLVSAINDSVEFNVKIHPFELTELISSVINEFDSMAKKKLQQIIFEKLNYPTFITSDRNKIKEVIENLLSNAIKYSKRNTEIRITVNSNASHIEFKIMDQGPGFSLEDLDKIFGKFQRLSARPTGNESSTGLGLFITKKIVDKLQGTIHLENKPGGGSIFTVALPVCLLKPTIENFDILKNPALFH